LVLDLEQLLLGAREGRERRVGTELVADAG
jgi:hypothetical protein